MASPFRIFRKYQKTLLVVAGVVLMFVFVIGDSLVSYISGTKNAEAGNQGDLQATAVHWDGGELTNRQLNELVNRRRILNTFLQQVQGEGELSARQAGVDPPSLRVQQLLGPDTPQQGIEQHVVRTKLFADAAREAGMNVSDDTIVQYLDELGRKNVSRERMRAILKDMSARSGRASIDYVIHGLRDEMLANNYLMSQQFAFQTVTPQQRWKDWLLVNDRVVIEAAAVPASSFLPEVKEPTEAELETLFNDYKDREASPERVGTTELPSPTPGFKIPRKFDLQIVQASYDDYVTKAEAKISDEEIAKYYDEHKNLFEKADTKLMEDADKSKEDQKKDSPESKDGAKEGTKEAKPDDSEKKATEADGKKTSEVAEKETKPTATENKSDGNQPAETQNQPASKDGKTEEAPEDKKSSYRVNPSKRVFRLAAFEENAEKKNADADKAPPPADAKKEGAEDKAATSSQPAPESKSDAPTKQPPTSPAAEPPAAGPSLPAASTQPPAAPGALSTPAVTAESAEKKPVQYQPLSEVKDLIRRQLAEGKVAEQLTKLTDDLQSPLKDDYDKWFNDRLTAEAENRPVPSPPKSLVDLAPLAEKNGLKVNRTGPKSGFELRDMPIGKTSDAESGRGLLSLLFSGHELDLYQPVTTVDIDGNRYIVMKMSDTPARVPTLAEAKSEVERMWKFQKAVELAKKHAEELAKKAQEAKAPLTTVFADNKDMKVVRTDPFSELTGGDVGFVNGQFQQQPFRLSQPDGIVAPGPDFMKRVFELKDGEVGVALNHDHSIAYVIRVVEHQPGINELRTAYLAEADTWPGRSAMMNTHIQEAMMHVARDVLAGANLTWDRPADKTSQDEQRDEG